MLMHNDSNRLIPRKYALSDSVTVEHSDKTEARDFESRVLIRFAKRFHLLHLVFQQPRKALKLTVKSLSHSVAWIAVNMNSSMLSFQKLSQ